MRKNSLLIFAVIFLAISIVGCANTFRGAGKDTSKVGDSMQKF